MAKRHRHKKKKGVQVENEERHEPGETVEPAGAAQMDDEFAAPPPEEAEDGEVPRPEAPAEDREAQLEAELAKTRDQLMRLAAEFENYKRRMKNEQDRLAKYAGENILRELLPTVDNLERAMGQGLDGDMDATRQLLSMLEGVGLTHKSLLATLERFGVQPIDSVGRPFNPEEQDALTTSPSIAVPKNHVLSEFAKGYRFKDRMLRHAQVVVSSGPPEPEEGK